MIVAFMVDDLPPLMTSAICMRSLGCEVTIAAVGCSDKVRDYLHKFGIHLVELGLDRYPADFPGKIRLRPKYALLLRKAVKETKPDVLWYHGQHAMTYHSWVSVNPNTLIIAHAHEYFEKRQWFGRIQNSLVRKADLFIVPEANRAWLIKHDSSADTPFLVIPNRYLFEDNYSEGDEKETLQAFKRQGGSAACQRFIIYQGFIDPSRCLREAIQGFKMLDDQDLGFIILGRGVNRIYCDEIAELAQSDTRIVLLDHIPPPLHLRITRGCFGGVLLYAPTSLNRIYCAPNKVYEYAFYGLGMILPNFPGMAQINDQFKLGVVCDPQVPESIFAALKELLQRESKSYQAASKNFLVNSPDPRDSYFKVFDFLKQTYLHS